MVIGGAMFMEWLRKAPTAVTVAVVIVCGVLALGLLGAFVLLSINGVDTTEFRQWVNTVGQILVYPLLGTTAVASVAAARSASAAEDSGNGRLHERDVKIADLERRLSEREKRDGAGPLGAA